MLIPEVIGFKLTGALKEGATATDLVLTVTQMLRKKGVVGKFVEFFGPALDHLSLPDRATIANMAPEYGATCGFFPIDKETVRYLTFSGRAAERIALVEALRQGPRAVARRQYAGAAVHRHHRARRLHRGAVARRTEAPAGQGRPVAKRCRVRACPGGDAGRERQSGGGSHGGRRRWRAAARADSPRT